MADAKKSDGIRFDLGTVGRPSEAPAFKSKDDVKLACGTTACAMGLAAISGEFKNLSFEISNQFFVNITVRDEVVDYDIAATKIFGIGKRAANYLFTPANYPDDIRAGAYAERFVANRIRRFVAGKVSKKTLQRVKV